jgi:hypothetical protein
MLQNNPDGRVGWLQAERGLIAAACLVGYGLLFFGNFM